MRFVLFFIVLSFAFVSFAELQCPQVFDGLTNGHFDLSTQFVANSLSANWAGLSGNDILSYEVAVISSAQLKNGGGCRSTPGFLGNPDTKQWFNVRKESSVTINNLKLVPQTTYHVVLRTTLRSGVQTFTNSNGITVLPQELNLEGSRKNVRREPIIVEVSGSSKAATCYAPSECPLDQANACRAGATSVYQYLLEFYGPPVFPRDELFGFFPVERTRDDDDDDHARNDGIIAGVVAGVLLLLLCCLALLALLSALFTRKGGDGQFKEDIVTTKKEIVDSNFGTTTDYNIGSDTRVEFPDIDPHSRLSQA